jgi:hypothetical protein
MTAAKHSPSNSGLPQMILSVAAQAEGYDSPVKYSWIWLNFQMNLHSYFPK